MAIWSAIQTGRFNKRQSAFAETAERLNQLLIDKEASDSQSQRKADVSATFIKIGKNNYRLKVFNKGMVPARNVRLEMLSGESLVGQHELQQKFPLQVLERHQSVELITSVHHQSPRRAHVRLHWDDDAGEAHNKELWIDVF
ncbi:hypothetical protein V2I08_14940 [Sphingobium sp. MK2]